MTAPQARHGNLVAAAGEGCIRIVDGLQKTQVHSQQQSITNGNIQLQAKNFSEKLQENVKLFANKNIIQFIHDDNRVQCYTFHQLHEKALSIAGELSQHYKVGSRAILLYPPSPEFIFAFWGCVYAGIIPVPAALPLKAINTIPYALKNIIDNCQPQLCLTDTSTYKHLRLHKLHHIFENIPLLNTITQKLTTLTPLDNDFNIAKIPTILTDKIRTNISHQIVNREPEDILFIQYTSGSTNIPKGVVITHRNALHNAMAINDGFDMNECSRLLIWMPQYHDLGLMGTTLHPIYTGYTMRFMSSLKFIRDPLCWLEKIHEFRADVSGGPNFAYDLCVRHYNEKRMNAIDLSAWSSAFCGAELIQYATLKNFAEVFAPHGFNPSAFLPCYGLAESTVYVSGSKNYHIDQAIFVDKRDLTRHRVTLMDKNARSSQPLVSAGAISAFHDVKIVDQKNQTLPEGMVGRIFIRSESVAPAYWSAHSEENALFAAKINQSSKSYFATGDLGFLHENHLYITGRDKEAIVIHGQNHYPQWIESAIANISDVIRKNCVAALHIQEFALDKIVIALEVNQQHKNYALDKLNQLAQSIVALIDNHFDLFIERILFLPKDTLTKTVSHKLARKLIAERITQEALPVLHTWRESQVKAQMPRTSHSTSF